MTLRQRLLVRAYDEVGGFLNQYCELETIAGDDSLERVVNEFRILDSQGFIDHLVIDGIKHVNKVSLNVAGILEAEELAKDSTPF
jgi:hypothetical protein